MDTARAIVLRFQEARIQFSVPRPPEPTTVAWKPPEDPYIKVNVDAAFSGIEQTASLGIVARDHLGAIVAWR